MRKFSLMLVDFDLSYAGEMVHCEAVMHDKHYEIILDGKLVGSIELNHDCDWVQKEGTTLSQNTVDEIGSKIEAHTC